VTPTPPLFEIGPKNLLRRDAIERVAVAAGRAGVDHDVNVLLTVPTALVAPVADLRSDVRVLAQGMDPDRPGPSMNRVTAESLVDAGAWGVMLNHDANPLTDEQLQEAIARAAEVGLATVVCAATEDDAVRFAGWGSDVVLYEPPALIGTDATASRDWVAGSTEAVHRAASEVLLMHAGGISTPTVARSVMASGADGTGSTSGVLLALDPGAAARDFIAATRHGWDEAHRLAPAR
jgi:triosephosphate isomerase